MMSAVVGLGKILTGLPASLAASLAKTIASKFPSPSSGKTDPKKAEPKTDPKKSEKTKPQPEPAKTDTTKKDKPKQPESSTKTDPKPKTEIQSPSLNQSQRQKLISRRRNQRNQLPALSQPHQIQQAKRGRYPRLAVRSPECSRKLVRVCQG